ncbi:hypothetical protein JHG98_004338 [Salmonella enterica]|nr:hypothetical protein [Salmonella enterica subsp. enterica serovar Panama]EGX9180314.1 hypothetical protein [Salmonella enterica]EGZ6497402.1 hypothetical protein [Salmonella enterica]
MSKLPSPDTVRRIEDASAALITAGTLNPTNAQATISPVICTEVLPLREQVVHLTATGEHQAAQLKETRAELKGSREENRALQAELLALARNDGKAKK